MRKKAQSIPQRKRLAMGERVTGMKNGGYTKAMQDGGMTSGPGARVSPKDDRMGGVGAAGRPGLDRELAQYFGGTGERMPDPPKNEPVINVITRAVRRVTGLKNGGPAKRGKKC